MRKDGLRRLPDHVVAPLLRALMCIPRTGESRLLLQPVQERRPPFWTMVDDYDVAYRGRRVGRIDREPDGRCEVPAAPWRWFLNWDGDGGIEVADPRRKMAHGRAATRGEAMTAFRRAFDEIVLDRADRTG
jgi:hypothetical protein